MILYLGNEEYYTAIKELSSDISKDIPISQSEKLIVTEYSNNAVNTVKCAIDKSIPIFGLEDGYKTVIEAFGGECYDLTPSLSGKQEWSVIDATSPAYIHLESVIQVCRANDFAVCENTCPKELDVMSRAETGEVLAMRNKIDAKTYGNVYAINFNLLSELTPDGKQIIKNIINM